MKRSTCFLGWKGGRYSFKRNLAIVDWFSGQLAGPMLPLGRLKTHLMFFRLRIFYHEKTQSWDIYLTWVTGRDQSILQQLYAVMFFLLICNGFYQVCPPMVNYYFFPTVNVFFLNKEFNIFNFAPHLIRLLIPNPSFDHIFEAFGCFWLKRMV